MSDEGYKPVQEELTPKQKEMAEKADLIIDNVEMGMGGSVKEIHGIVTIDGKRFNVNFKEDKSEGPGREPNSEPRYRGSILGNRDEAGNEYWKEVEGEAAKKLFEFYAPISNKRDGFKNTQEIIQDKTEDKSVEDLLLGGE